MVPCRLDQSEERNIFRRVVTNFQSGAKLRFNIFSTFVSFSGGNTNQNSSNWNETDVIIIQADDWYR